MLVALDRALVVKKVRELVPHIAIDSPEHVHLDRLFKERVPAEAVLGVCADLLDSAVRELGARTAEIQAMVIIPLEPSATLQVEPPSQSKLLKELANEKLEPPALYLMKREAWKLIVRQEEYRRPLPIPAFVRDRWYPEYRTMRSAPDELFGRSIWVSHLLD